MTRVRHFSVLVYPSAKNVEVISVHDKYIESLTSLVKDFEGENGEVCVIHRNT